MAEKTTVLIPDRVHPIAADQLREAGLAVIAPGQMSRAETLSAVAHSTALIVRSATQVDAALLAAARQLRFVVRAGAGVDNVDLPCATERGIIVMNTPGVNALAVAEYTIGLLLALARYIPQAHMSLREGEWNQQAFMGVTLYGKVLGIYGFGRIGQAVAERAQAFGMRFLAHDPFVPAAAMAEKGVEAVGLETLWAEADFLSLHAEVNEHTRGIVNEASIARMKPGVRIINAARGALIDTSALAAALQRGAIAGAALDVFEPEPPPADYPLLAAPGVVHTPHLAANAKEVQEALARAAADTLLQALQQGSWQNVCNPEVLAKDAG
ncbi:MAG: hydroxyacid dehydrogenase [Anaerolineaceae bacterium]|nr:hydroxyacid dehydrogenase [Anaerolineaceae bacterium]